MTITASIGILFAIWLLGLISGLMGSYVHIFLVLALAGALMKASEDRKKEDKPERSYSQGQRTFHIQSRSTKDKSR